MKTRESSKLQSPLTHINPLVAVTYMHGFCAADLLCASEAAEVLTLDCKHLEKPPHRFPLKMIKSRLQRSTAAPTEGKDTHCSISDKTLPVSLRGKNVKT